MGAALLMEGPRARMKNLSHGSEREGRTLAPESVSLRSDLLKRRDPPMRRTYTLLFLLPALFVAPVDAADKFELRDGDRVVLIGNTLVEREQRYGYWETLL